MTSVGNELKQTTADEFSAFYDQMLAQPKENLTKCSQKTEWEFQLVALAKNISSEELLTVFNMHA